jgi:protein TonB
MLEFFLERRKRTKVFTAVAVSTAHAALGFWAIGAATPCDPAMARGAEGPSPAIQVSLVRLNADEVQQPQPQRQQQVQAQPAPAKASPSTADAAQADAQVAAVPAEASTATASATVANAASGSTAQSDDNALFKSYREQLRIYVSRFQHYPEEARRQGVQGRVQVAFALDRDGQIYHITIGRSSGVATLDQEALESVRRAAPLPPIPASLPSPFIVQIPVVFDLS